MFNDCQHIPVVNIKMVKDLFVSEKKYRAQKGFTLIEIAAVLFITGVSMLGIAQFINIYKKSTEHKTTITNLEMAYDALEEYAGLSGYYPCPANPKAKPGDLDYGRSACRDDAEASFNADACTNVPIGISCTTTNSRDGDSNGQKDVVMIGAFPFRDIAEKVKDTPFKEFHKVDGYGTLLSYAVTEHMTETNPDNSVMTPFDPITGSIAVLDENLISVMGPEKEAQFVVFSHGFNGMGGYSKEGQPNQNCYVPSMAGGIPDTVPTPGPYSGNGKIETENCDNNDAIFIKGLLSLADNNDYYDDYLYYKGRGLSTLWENSMVSMDEEGESYIYNTNPGGVGVGTPEPDTKLHIMGDLSSINELVSGEGYCDNGINCVDPEFLGGTGHKCPNPDEVAYAIGNNEVVCRKVEWTVPNKSCLPIMGVTSYIRGFSNLGNLYCCTNAGDCEKQ